MSDDKPKHESEENQYRFSICESPSKTVSLFDDDKPVVCFAPEVDTLWFAERDKVEQAYSYEPTDQFWELIVYIQKETSNIADFINHADAYGVEDNVPDLRDWKCTTDPTIPKYEQKIAFELTHIFAELKLETHDMYSKYSKFRKLIRRAFIETGRDVPYYLTEENAAERNQ